MILLNLNKKSDDSFSRYFRPDGAVPRLYPNPTTGPLTLSVKDGRLPQAMLYLRDPLGKLIKQIDLSRTNTKELTIDITFAPPGIYFLYLDDGKENWVMRVVRE